MTALASRIAICGLAVALLVGAVLGLAVPTELAGGAGWSLAAGGVLWGLGAGVNRRLRIALGLGEQILLGVVVWLSASGILLAGGVASRGPLLAVAGAGFALAMYELLERARRAEERPRPDAAHLVLGLALALILALNLLAMIATRGNPYDDQAAYTAFVKRLLDCGDLVEPYNFRRLSAYGGQTALHALAALRGDVESIDLLDRGIFQIVAVLVALDLAGRRRLHIGLTVGVIAFLLSLWDLNLNSASTWTGFACFTGVYAIAVRDDLPPRTALVLTCALCAAACTLRQNYVVPAGLFAILQLVLHMRARARESSWRSAWLAERTTLLLAAAAVIAVLAPYMIAAWSAVGSLLYPVIQGYANPAAPLVPTGGTPLDELQFFVSVLLNPEPIRIWWLLLPVMLLAKDPHDRRPWPAFLVACGAGFVLLVHSFQLSDNYNLWRYAFGYLSPLATVFAIETAAALPLKDSGAAPRLTLPGIGALLAWVAILAHFAVAHPEVRFAATIDHIKAGLVQGSRKADPFPDAYRELQAAVPAGASMAVMLDDPYHLDYDRNPIFTLDLPGFVAPPPGLPSFTTPEHWRAYFRARGIRYLAFVSGDHSGWLYRRTGWLWRIYADDELFRFIAAHMVDTIDAFEALAKTSRVLFHGDGLYTLDLGERVPDEPPRGEPELARMDRFARSLSERELHNNAWQLAARRDVVFQRDGAGPSLIVPMPAVDPEGGPAFWQNLIGSLDEPPHRWLIDRTHVRVRGQGQHRLRMKLWLKSRRLYTTPTMVLLVDGVERGRAQPDATGHLAFDTPVACEGWCDVYLIMSTMSEWWLSADALRAAKLLEFEWTPAS
jgi:hypothetical protein